MRFFMFQLGKFLGIVFPYKIYASICHLMQWLYTGYRVRNFKHFGKQSKMGFAMHIVGEKHIVVDDNVIIGGGGSLTAFPNDDGNKIMISIGAGSVFGHDVHITAANGIFIGKGLRTGKSVLISDNAHGNCRDQKQLLMRPDDRPLYSKGAIFIGENVWIGEKAAILSGVHVGDGAVIGANSVVTHDVPAFSIVAGCPAKIK